MGKISSTSQKISKLVSTSRNWHLQISKTSGKFGIKKKKTLSTRQKIRFH